MYRLTSAGTKTSIATHTTAALLALTGGLLLMPRPARTELVSYTVQATTGDSWSGFLDITDMDAPAASTGSGIVPFGDTVTTVATASASGSGTFPTNIWYYFAAGNMIGLSSGFGDQLLFYSEALSQALVNNAKTWAEILQTGTFAFTPYSPNPGDPAMSAVFTYNNEAESINTQYIAYGAGSVTFATVPEPSTCIMALAGLACGGYATWRRRRRA